LHLREKWNRWLGLVLFLLIADVILGPLLLAAFLVRNRSRIAKKDADLAARWGVLYEAYSPSMYWFEVTVLFRRVAFVALEAQLITLPPERSYSFVILSVLLFIAQLYLQPFAVPRENKLEAMSLLLLVFISATVLLRPQRNYTVALIVWLSFLVILPSAVLFVLVMQGWWQKLLAWCRWPKQLLQQPVQQQQQSISLPLVSPSISALGDAAAKNQLKQSQLLP
jgi:hypothetical protein